MWERFAAGGMLDVVVFEFVLFVAVGGCGCSSVGVMGDMGGASGVWERERGRCAAVSVLTVRAGILDVVGEIERDY